MFDRQFINVVDVETTMVRTEFKDAFEVRLDRPHVWLQRICCYILGRLNATSWKVQPSCKAYTIDAVDLMSKIQKQYILAQEISREPLRRVYIGRDDFHNLLGIPLARHQFTFNITPAINRYVTGDFHGLDVYVIPWMQGVLIVP